MSEYYIRLGAYRLLKGCKIKREFFYFYLIIIIIIFSLFPSRLQTESGNFYYNRKKIQVKSTARIYLEVCSVD